MKNKSQVSENKVPFIYFNYVIIIFYILKHLYVLLFVKYLLSRIRVSTLNF